MKDQIDSKIDELVKIYSEEVIRSIDDTHVNKIIKDCIHEAITFGQSLERERMKEGIDKIYKDRLEFLSDNKLPFDEIIIWNKAMKVDDIGSLLQAKDNE